MKNINLTNSKMGKIVARLLGKTELDVKDGKVILTADEREIVLREYGKNFLDKLESVDIESDALDLFKEAVNAKTAEATAALRTQVAKLQDDVLKLAQQPEPVPQAQGAEKRALTDQHAINLSASHNKIVSAALNSENPVSFAMLEDASIDVADLNKEFSMVMPPKQRLELLTQRIYRGFDDSKYMTRIQSNTDFIASTAIFSEVSQQFTPKWTPKGTSKFTPCRIPYRRHKLNVLIRPTEVLKSWLLYLYEQGKTMSEMPITKYIIEQHILPKTLEDITLSMIGKGKFVDNSSSVTENSAGPKAKESMDGYETQLVEGKKDADCKFNFYKAVKNPLLLSDSDLLSYVNGFVDAVSDMFVGTFTVFCSEQLLIKYKRADFAINGKYTGDENDGSIRFTKFRLTPLKSMYNSPIIFATPESNFVELVDYSRANNCINKIEESNYDVKVFGEYSLSVGFKIQEAVFAAVPDGYDPATTISSGEMDENKWEHGKSAVSEDEAKDNAENGETSDSEVEGA